MGCLSLVCGLAGFVLVKYGRPNLALACFAIGVAAGIAAINGIG